MRDFKSPLYLSPLEILAVKEQRDRVDRERFKAIHEAMERGELPTKGTPPLVVFVRYPTPSNPKPSDIAGELIEVSKLHEYRLFMERSE